MKVFENIMKLMKTDSKKIQTRSKLGILLT